MSARRDHRLLIAGALLTALPFVFGLLLAHGPAGAAHAVQVLDGDWQRWAGATGEQGPAHRLALVLNFFGTPPGKVLALALTVPLLVLRRWWAALYFWTGIALAATVSQGVKNLVDRPRPAGTLVPVDHGSLPSGHVIQAAGMVVLLAALLPARVRRWWLLSGGLYTLAMMWSRTYLRAHWLTDTVAGLSAGVGVGLLCWWAFTPVLRPSRSPDSSPDPRPASRSAGAARPR
jgi:membrane-associated phospholipid phosphatase